MGIKDAEIDRMASAFEHADLERAAKVLDGNGRMEGGNAKTSSGLQVQRLQANKEIMTGQPPWMYFWSLRSL
jgi:hypothetical protein